MVAYQQAPAVPKPPAAVLSGQHEGEGLTADKNKFINVRINAGTQTTCKNQSAEEDLNEFLSSHSTTVVCSSSSILMGPNQMTRAVGVHINISGWLPSSLWTCGQEHLSGEKFASSHVHTLNLSDFLLCFQFLLSVAESESKCHPRLEKWPRKKSDRVSVLW